MLAIVILLPGCSTQSTEAPTLPATLPISVPASIDAGKTLIVKIGPVDIADGSEVTLVVVGSYGPQVYRTSFAGKTAQFVLSGEATRQAGELSLMANAGAAHGTTHLVIRAGPVANAITPLIGPRTVIADGYSSSMVVVAPSDQYGNPVADGTPFEVRALRPNGELEIQPIQAQGLLAWMRIRSGTNAGRTFIGVTTSTAHGPEATLDETAGSPVGLTVAAEARTLSADGRQLIEIHSEPIRDRYGNQVPDGTLITFVVTTPNKTRRSIPALTIDGVARVPLQAPHETGELTVQAVAANIESEPLTIALAAGPVTGTLPLTATVEAERGAVALVAGPMLGTLGQYIPDGTPVQFRLSASDGTNLWAEAPSNGGYAQVEIRLAAIELGDYLATVQAGTAQGEVTFQVP